MIRSIIWFRSSKITSPTNSIGASNLPTLLDRQVSCSSLTKQRFNFNDSNYAPERSTSLYFEAPKTVRFVATRRCVSALVLFLVGQIRIGCWQILRQYQSGHTGSAPAESHQWLTRGQHASTKDRTLNLPTSDMCVRACDARPFLCLVATSEYA